MGGMVKTNRSQFKSPKHNNKKRFKAQSFSLSETARKYVNSDNETVSILNLYYSRQGEKIEKKSPLKFHFLSFVVGVSTSVYMDKNPLHF